MSLCDRRCRQRHLFIRLFCKWDRLPQGKVFQLLLIFPWGTCLATALPRRITDWYDGYEVSGIVRAGTILSGEGLGASAEAERYSPYSPLSVVKAVSTGYIQNWWNKTESYEALAAYIRMDFDGLRSAVALLVDGGRLSVDLSGYQNDMTTFASKDDVLALLVHLGYLGFDSWAGEVFVPNREVLDEFRTSTRDAEWKCAFQEYEASKELLRATWAGDEQRVAALLEDDHDRAGNRTYNAFLPCRKCKQ